MSDEYQDFVNTNKKILKMEVGIGCLIGVLFLLGSFAIYLYSNM